MQKAKLYNDEAIKNSNNKKEEEWASLIEEYKRIISTQQYKYVKIEQQLKLAEVRYKFY